jgi:hypothetical protein
VLVASALSMVFPIQMVLPFFVQQIADLPLQNVIDFIKSVYLERLSLHMVFNGDYQKSHFCFFGLVTKAGGTFTIMTALIITKSSRRSVSKLNKDGDIQATSLFSIAQHHAFSTKCVVSCTIA